MESHPSAVTGIDQLLARLDGVRPTGRDRWVARCPAHDDRTPSLAIRSCPDGRVLLHCFALCPVADVVAAVGLNLGDLFPDRPIDHHIRRERRPFLPSDVFSIIGDELRIVLIVSSDLRKGWALSAADHARLVVALDRLQRIKAAAYGK